MHEMRESTETREGLPVAGAAGLCEELVLPPDTARDASGQRGTSLGTVRAVLAGDR
jgi:hypothetical protein